VCGEKKEGKQIKIREKFEAFFLLLNIAIKYIIINGDRWGSSSCRRVFGQYITLNIASVVVVLNLTAISCVCLKSQIFVFEFLFYFSGGLPEKSWSSPQSSSSPPRRAVT